MPWAFWLTAAWGVGVAVVLVPLLIGLGTAAANRPAVREVER